MDLDMDEALNLMTHTYKIETFPKSRQVFHMKNLTTGLLGFWIKTGCDLCR